MKKTGSLIALITALLTVGCKEEEIVSQDYVPRKGQRFCTPSDDPGSFCITFEYRAGYDVTDAIINLKQKYKKKYSRFRMTNGTVLEKIEFPYDNRSFWWYVVFDKNENIVDKFALDSKGCRYTK